MITDPIQSNTSLPPVANAPGSAARPRPSETAEAASTKAALEKFQQQEPSLNDLQDATQRVASFVGSIRSELNFTVDQSSGVNVVKVVDSNTKEVIRQIPSREIIQLAQALDKLQGLFVKDKA